MDTQKKQTKPKNPKNPKKKAVKRKPRKKPAVKKSITQKQTVTQNVKVVVGEMKQRRRQNRSLFHKQPQRQYQQPPTIIYQQAPIQQVAPQSLTPQQQPQQQPQPQQPQQQPQPQQQTAPITQPTPQPLTAPQTQPTPSPLTQPTAPPQASPVTPTIPTPPPPIQPQTQPTPPPITPIVPSITPAERTVMRPTSPANALTRPAPSLSLMEQIQQRARERADRVSSSTDALTEPPKTSQPRPVQALSLQEQIQQKAKERQARVDLGDERKTEQPKGKGSVTKTPLPPPKTDLMAEILKKGKELTPVSARPKTTPPPPKSDEKSKMVDLMKSKMKGRRIGIGSGSDDEDDDIGAFSVAGELPKKEIITPEIVTVAAKPLLKPSKEDTTTLDDLTTPKPKGGVYNLDGTFIRGSTTGRNIGIPKKAEDAFNEYVTKHSKTEVKDSSSSKAVDGKITTKKMTFKKNKEYIEDFNKLLALTGDTAKGLEGKLKRANQGNPPKFV